MTIDTKENDTFVCKRLMSDDRGNNFVFRLISLFWGSLLCKDYATCKKNTAMEKRILFIQNLRFATTIVSSLWGQTFVIAFAGAGAAEGAPVLHDFAFEIDAFAAFGADDAGAFEARQIFGLDFDFHPLFIEENFVGELCVGFLLAGVLAEFRKHFAGSLLGRFFRGDAHGTAGLQVDESGGDFAPIAEFQRALAKSAVGDKRDGVSDAAVDLYVRDNALALGDGIVDAEFAQPEHRQAHAENLSGAEVAVGHRGQLEIFS